MGTTVKNQKTTLPHDTYTELNKTLDGRRHLERLNIMLMPKKKKEFDQALKTLIESLDAWLFDAALKFECGDMRDEEILSQLESALEPGIQFERKFLTDGFEQGIQNEVTSAQHDALSSLEACLRRMYFKAGVLMGARLKGASIEELRKIGKRW
jgi:hypothetical protein